MPDDNILDDLHAEYLSKVLSLNSSVWSTLITLHAIIISAFALTLSSLLKKTSWSIYVIVFIILLLSLSSIFLLFKNFIDYRDFYNKLSYHTHPKIRNEESLKAERGNAETINKRVNGREAFAKHAFYIGFACVFYLLLFYIY